MSAMPPFTQDEDIFFNAGNHEQTVHLAYADFARLVQPRIASFGMGGQSSERVRLKGGAMAKRSGPVKRGAMAKRSAPVKGGAMAKGARR